MGADYDAASVRSQQLNVFVGMFLWITGSAQTFRLLVW